MQSCKNYYVTNVNRTVRIHFPKVRKMQQPVIVGSDEYNKSSTFHEEQKFILVLCSLQENSRSMVVLVICVSLLSEKVNKS